MSVNSKATKIIHQRKAFCWQIIQEPNRMRKETVDIDILLTSRNDEIKSCNLSELLCEIVS